MAANHYVNITMPEYISDEDLVEIELYQEYPESLIRFAYTFCMIFTLIGIPGNLITILALASCKKFRNATAFFIINLQTCHLIFCCTVLPMSAATFYEKHWMFGNILCKVYPLLKYGLNGTAHFTVVAITVNRYVIICHPHIYPKLYKKKILIMTLLSTWISGFVLFIPALFGLWGRFALDLTGGNCSMLPDKNNICPKKFFVSLAFVAPYSFIIICYSRIWWTVRKTAMKRAAHDTKTIKPDVSTDNELDSTVVEKRSVCLEPSTYDNTINKDTSTPNTPNKQVNSMIYFFKKSFRITKKEKRVHLPTRKDKKLATMIAAIIVSFTVCHLPIMLTRFLYGNYKSYAFLNISAHLLDYSSAFMRPIIYVIMSSEYRQVYISLYKDCKNRMTKCIQS